MDPESFGTIDYQFAGRMATTPPEDDGPVWMVNFMRYKQRADYGADRDDGTEAISGREADDRYAPVDVLRAIGADVAYFGDVVRPDGTADPEWDRMAVVRYPTRKSFIDMQTRPDFKEKAVHKEAGMEFTIVMCAVPRGTVGGTPDGSGVVRFIAYPVGSAPGDEAPAGAHFDIEGTVIGDDRRWGHLVVTWSDGGGDLPDAAMVTRSLPSIDRIRPLLDGTPGA
jgi:hypothetical protein